MDDRITRTDVRISDAAEVDDTASIGSGTTIWPLATIREDATIGRECTIGRGVYVGPGAFLGNRVKVQNLALVYEPARLEDGVFVGPAAVLTNDEYPRAVTPDGRRMEPADWQPVAVVAREGASIGAGAVCVAPVTIGRWALVAAGAVVVADVPDFALVVGVPARRIGWVGRAGARLTPEGDGRFVCPRTGARYVESGGRLTEADPAQ